MKKILHICLLVLVVASCARMGNPDGGWYDDTPPYVVSSTPEDRATGVDGQRIVINFNEYIRLQDAQSKVIVSPPQLEMPEIKDNGKRIIVELKDSLKKNTTYTIDFGDAISDFTENNPMGNYAFTFSTGSHVDTLQVAGYVLNAENLEPVKDILVGLYQNLADSAFCTEPMIRVSRTDGSGHFSIKGVAPGTYRAYALQDADNNYVYSQKSEMLAFNHDTFVPTWKPDIRQDTIWRDSLHIDNILRTPYTHFLPDEITLLAFTAVQDSRYLLKTERKQPDRLDFYFTYGDSLPPQLRGLNFDADSAFIIEATPKNDTIFYWLRDTTLINQDTLMVEATYNMTDTTNLLVSKTDTLEFLAKETYEKRQKAKQKEFDEWKKAQDKRKKKGERYDSIQPPKYLNLKISPSGNIEPTGSVTFESPTPLARIDTSGIHLSIKVDSTWHPIEYTFHQQKENIRLFELSAKWKTGEEYNLVIDSAAFTDIYGLVTNAKKESLKLKKEEDYGTLAVNLTGVQDTGIVVQLLNNTGNAVMQTRAKRGTAMFKFITPGKYFLKAFTDPNGNNIWDTGDYDADRQPEAVYFYPQEIECKAKWDIARDWDLTALPRFQQKPSAIVKQKADKEKKLKNRNLERAKQLGKDYIQKSTGMKM